MDVVFFATGNNLALKGGRLATGRPLPAGIGRRVSRGAERLPHSGRPPGLRQDRARDRWSGPRSRSSAATSRRAGPTGATPMDYPAWCGLIRNAVHWATGGDPCAPRLMFQSDEDSCQLRGLIDGWEALCGECGQRALRPPRPSRRWRPTPRATSSSAGSCSIGPRMPRLPSPRVVGNHLNKVRGHVVAGKMLQFSVYCGNRTWFVQPVGSARATQPAGVSVASSASPQPNPEDELSDAEKKEIADVLAEVRGCRNPTRFRETYCGEVIR